MENGRDEKKWQNRKKIIIDTESTVTKIPPDKEIEKRVNYYK